MPINPSKIASVGFFGVATASAYLATKSLLDYSSIKSEILHQHLSRAPELTDQVLQSAKQSIDHLTQGDLGLCVTYSLMAGFTLGMAIYLRANPNSEKNSR